MSAARPFADAGNAAERTGGAIADYCVKEMRAATTQGERIRILQMAIIELAEQPRLARAAGGFAVLVTAWMESGIGDAK